jgi:hypothetical protein
MQIKTIELPQGGELEVNMSPEFLKKVSEYYKLSSIDQVNDDHIRHFIHDVFSVAILNAQPEVV